MHMRANFVLFISQTGVFSKFYALVSVFTNNISNCLAADMWKYIFVKYLLLAAVNYEIAFS